MGSLLKAQLHENAGELDQALACATRAWANAERAGDTWSLAAAAQSLAQSHSQLAHPAEALEWAQRSYDHMAQLQADGDMHQLDWLIAINAISSGDTARGRRLLERYLAVEVDRSGIDYADYYAIGYAGMAEIALAEGDVPEAVRLYRQSLEAFGDAPGGRAGSLNPWLIVLSSAALTARLRAHTADDALDRSETDAAAAALRTRILVTARLSPPYLDRPVIGSGLLGYAAWMLDPRTVEAHGDGAWLESGLTLFALTGRANSRQDVASLHRDPIAARIAADWGRERLDAALAAVGGVGPEQAVARGLALLAAVRAS
jgi:tetratricopeptide (TPR) repeat protein